MITLVVNVAITRSITLSDLHANIPDVFNEQKMQTMTPSCMADMPEPKNSPIPAKN